MVHLRGELDGATAELLDGCLGSIEPGFTTVILDLRDLAFVDSMGLWTLVRHHRRLDEAARLLQLRNMNGHPLRALEMTELRDLLRLV